MTACRWLFSLAVCASAAASVELLANRHDHFLVLGDWGSQGTEYAQTQKEVAAAMARYTDQEPMDFVLSTGDNFYPSGVQSASSPRFQTDFSSMYTGTEPWLISLGNHDYEGIVEAQLQFSQDKRWTLPGRNYTARYCLQANASSCSKYATIIALDTTPWILDYYKHPETPEQGRQLASQHWKYQLYWLEATLAGVAATDEILVFGHHFIFSKDGPTSDLVQNLLPTLEKYQVAAFIAGHKHELQMLSGSSMDFWISGAGSRLDVDIASANQTAALKPRSLGNTPKLEFDGGKQGAGFLSFKANAEKGWFMGHFIGTAGNVLFKQATPFRRGA